MAGTLLDIRTAVVQDTGDYGLVGISGSSPDFTTDGASKTGVLNRHINDAITFICDKVPGYCARQSYYAPLSPGQFAVQVPRLRTAKEAYIVRVSDTSRTLLLPADLADLRALYPQPWDTVTSGYPKYITVADHSEVSSTELIANLTSTDGPGWAISGTGCTRSAYQLTFVPGANIVARYLFDGVIAATPYATLTRYGKIRLRMFIEYSSSENGDGEAGELFLQYYDPDTSDFVLAATINKGGWVEAKLPAGSPGFIINSHTTFNGAVTINAISARLSAWGDTYDLTNDLQTGKILLLMPPTDTGMSLRVFGDFYPSTLSAITDYNNLTKKRPDLVVVGACWKWAQAQGLTALANHHAGHLSALIRELAADVAEGIQQSLEDAQGLIFLED